METKKEKSNYLLGTIGALIGGLIATIPWILTYVYGNMMLSILAVVIAIGEFYGYKLFKGKITKKVSIIIMILAVLIVIFTSLVSIPTFLLMEEGVNVSANNIKMLYDDEDFMQALMKDTGVAVLFTILGASVITENIKKQIKNGNGEELDLTNKGEREQIKKESIEKIKPIFKKFNAFTEEHGILKDELNAEINEKDKKEELNQALNILKSYKIVKKAKGKYYYSEEAEKNQVEEKATNKDKSKTTTIIIAVILVAVMIGVVCLNKAGIINEHQISNSNIDFSVNGKWTDYMTDGYNTGWMYYRYINNKEPENFENITETDEIDYSTMPAFLTITDYTNASDEIGTIEEIKANCEESINSLEEKPSSFETEILKTTNGYDMLKIKLIYEQEPSQIGYTMYILNGNKLVTVDASSVNLLDDEILEETANEVAQSLTWK